jgi:predicted small metal-binding protein
VVWGTIRPQRRDELVRGYVAGSIEYEVDEKQPAESSRQQPFDSLAADLDHQPAANLDLAPGRVRQRFVNIAATLWPYNEGGPGRRNGMAKLINCECGFVARGETDREVIEKIRAHLKQDHPELAAKVTRDDLLGWITEE